VDPPLVTPPLLDPPLDELPLVEDDPLDVLPLFGPTVSRCACGAVLQPHKTTQNRARRYTTSGIAALSRAAKAQAHRTLTDCQPSAL